MNNSLIKYQSKKKFGILVGGIMQFLIKIKLIISKPFFIKNMNCWGWGTWRDRWKKLNLNQSFLISLS